MIRPPSLQKHSTAFYSRDPAFVQLPPAPDGKASPEILAEHAKLREEHQRKWQVARETGNYSELLVEGEAPTSFTMRPLPGDVIRKLQDRRDAGALGDLEALQIAFRAALVDVVNAGDLKMAWVKDPDYGRIASTAVSDALDAHDVGIVTELGVLAMTSGSLSPKS